MAGKKRGFVTYRSYMFKDRDPVIDAVRTAVSESRKSYTQIQELSDVRAGTVRNWLHGNVRRPSFTCVAAVMLSLGRRNIVFRNGKPHFE